MSFYDEEIEQAKNVVLERLGYAPIAIVLGSGLGEFPKVLSNVHKLPYSDIPHMPRPSIQGHSGELILGELPDKTEKALHDVLQQQHSETKQEEPISMKKIYCFAGRVHSYEGIPWNEVTFQVKLMSAIGCKLFILTNASGGLFDDMTGGCLCLLTGHSRLLARMNPNSILENIKVPKNPLKTPIYPKWDEHYSNVCREIAKENNIKLFEGSYVWSTGPTFETPLEVLVAKQLGGACVGMSTVPEMLTCNQYGMDCIGISMVCNLGAGLQKEPLTHKEVLENSRIGMEHIQLLVQETLSRIDFEKVPLKQVIDRDLITLKKADIQLPILEEDLLKAIDLLKNRLGEWNVNQASIYCTEGNVPKVISDKVFVNELPKFPYATASGNFGYFTKNDKNQLILVSNQHPNLDNMFSTLESYYLSLLFNILNIPNIVYYVKSSSYVTPDEINNEITSVTNFGYHQPLEYLESVFSLHKDNVKRFKDIDPTTIGSQVNAYMSFIGPDSPTLPEIEMAKQFGHSLYGVSSLNLYFALKYLGINTLVYLEYQGPESSNKNDIQIWNTTHGMRDVRKIEDINYKNIKKLQYTLLDYDKVEVATNFVKEQLKITENTKIENAIFDLNLNLSFNDKVEIISKLALVNVPNYAERSEIANQQYLSLVKLNDKYILLFHYENVQKESNETYMYSNSLVDLSFFVRVCQHFTSIKDIYLTSAMASALNGDDNNSIEYKPLYSAGTICQLKDHVNFTGYNPLIGKNEPKWGERFFDIGGLYYPLQHSTETIPIVNAIYTNHAIQFDDRQFRAAMPKFNTTVLSSVGCYEALVSHHDLREKEHRLHCHALGLIVDESIRNVSENPIIPLEKKDELVDIILNEIAKQ
ncbi:hypothetical protein ABK040_003830 [Willaertia magna]